MGYVCVIGGPKGGVGKSTTAISLACEWRRRGLEVLLVDTDPQRTVDVWADIARERGHADESPVVRWLDASKLEAQLPALAAAFDVCVVDTPKVVEAQEAAIAVADELVVPCGPQAHDLWALHPALPLLAAERKRRRSFRAHVYVVKFSARAVMGPAALEALDAAKIPRLQTISGARADYAYASAAGQGVTVYAPRSEASHEVRRLAVELEGLSRGRIPVRQDEAGETRRGRAVSS